MPRTAITDLSTYVGKDATPTQERFADWIEAETGIQFGTQKERTAFRDGVRLAKALVMRYQASDANKEATAQEKAERAAAAEKSAAEPKPDKAAKAAKSAAAPAEEAAPAVPATRGRRGKAAKAATAPATADAPF